MRVTSHLEYGRLSIWVTVPGGYSWGRFIKYADGADIRFGKNIFRVIKTDGSVIVYWQ